MVNSLLYINTGIQKYLYRWKYHYDISKYLVIVTGLKGNIKASWVFVQHVVRNLY